MPSSTTERRLEVAKIISVSDEVPDAGDCIQYLLERGWHLAGWEWYAPTHGNEQPRIEDDLEVVSYLQEEWDFGGVIGVL